MDIAVVVEQMHRGNLARGNLGAWTPNIPKSTYRPTGYELRLSKGQDSVTPSLASWNPVDSLPFGGQFQCARIDI